jgi:hypothetical protein
MPLFRRYPGVFSTGPVHRRFRHDEYASVLFLIRDLELKKRTVTVTVTCEIRPYSSGVVVDIGAFDLVTR